ncbi:FAD/NAD(P)-binding domain-containing protein [Polyplosphaeria fusca]|uniref:FAD/NAD(P)-binding domain-containing protein n=1 Tax=Polyplosphaeria fusca TaxID=682080 RepID=A0A9P4UY09_9PLEO|nr:FAD/NAD(P)-binding domain-containing protein [Polyplosphaeria fusca]
MQTPGPNTTLDPPQRIAIVGAGVAGASAAFHLRELSSPNQYSLTIYEDRAAVGGRVISVHPPAWYGHYPEVGASHFFADDHCLMEAKDSAGLKYAYNGPWEKSHAGLYTGDDIVSGPSCNLESPSWGDLTSLSWKYGISAWRLHRATLSASTRLKSFGASKSFGNVVHEIRGAGFAHTSSGSAESYFGKLGISPRLLADFVEPCTRARSCQNLVDASPISALLALMKTKEAKIYESNDVLVEGMIKLSGADLHLNSTVLNISDGETRRYRLTIANKTPESAKRLQPEFDIVILAFPMSGTGIGMKVQNLSEDSKVSFTAPQSYTQSHITHFSSALDIISTFFHPSLDVRMPYDLLTTANSSNILSIRRSTARFNRIECIWDDECDQFDEDENLYRIVSRQPISDDDVAKLIGKEGQSLDEYDIGWVHRQAWPRAIPNYSENLEHGDGNKIEIAPKLFYLGGAERYLSSMEMSCRMGRNAARLLRGPGDAGPEQEHAEL